MSLLNHYCLTAYFLQRPENAPLQVLLPSTASTLTMSNRGNTTR